MAFKMRSGNAPKFKMVGSSPVKKDISPLDSGELYNRLRDQERINSALAEQLRDTKKDNTTRNERVLRGTASGKDKADQRVQWEKKQEYLNEMAWNKEGGTGDWKKDRWSGSKVRDLRFSFKDALMGGDLTSGFSTKEGKRKSNNTSAYWPGGDLFGPRPDGGGRRKKKKKKKSNSCTLTSCPAFPTGPQLNTDMN